MSEEDYKIAYENVMIANKMLEKENKQLKEDKKKAREYIKNNTYFKDNVVKTMIFKDFSNDLLEILGDKENDNK